MTSIAIGESLPPTSIAATGGQPIDLNSYRGQAIALYFYPKDNTPGCTNESIDFATHHVDFARAGCVVLGVSRDSVKSHEKFKAKHDMPFELLSDEDATLCQLFDVIKMKNMYGKQFEGIERSTFLIDKDGVLRQEWRKVKVKGHVTEVLAAARAL